jgi:hypothetical protein
MPVRLNKVLLSKAVNVSVIQEAQKKKTYFTWLEHAEMESKVSDAILFSFSSSQEHDASLLMNLLQCHSATPWTHVVRVKLVLQMELCA